MSIIDATLLDRAKYMAESIATNHIYGVENIINTKNAILQDGILHNVNLQPQATTYWVTYSMKYRPLWLSEWILLRGWRNDKGLWTADGIFIDWQ